MIYFINFKLKQSSRLFGQIIYYSLTGGVFMTCLSIISGYMVSYFKGGEGYLLMSIIALVSFLFVLLKGKSNV